MKDKLKLTAKIIGIVVFSILIVWGESLIDYLINLMLSVDISQWYHRIF